jgi:hypothetical protein
MLAADSSRPGLMVRWVRGLAAMLLGLGGTVIFARVMGAVYPLRDWLAWPMMALWGWVLLMNLACLSFGHRVLVRVLKLGRLPALEAAVFSMVVGTVGFILAMYLGGAFGWYVPSFGVALPLGLLALGGLDGARLLVRCSKDVASSRYTVWSLVIGAFGVLCVGLLYLGLLTPDAVNYDASWYHLRMAQDYARWGRIEPFWDYNAIVPHLASILYTWGYLVPGLEVAQRWMMALHLEFSLFLWTLAGVAAGVRRLVGDASLTSSWAAFFLFPIIFVYDHNLGAAADHVLAFFSVPVALATLRVLEGFTRGRCALLAIALAGATLAKYQAVYLIAPVVVMVSVGWLRAWLRIGKGYSPTTQRALRRNLWWAPAILVGLGTLLVSPHFIKNLIFYHNPVYPFLQDVIESTPTVPNAHLYVQCTFTDISWVPKGTFWMKVENAVKLFFTFSFYPHYSFTNNVPAFGSLFTLLLPGLLLVPGRRAIALVAFIATTALLAWGMTYNVDRNLQTFMPVLVCITGALLVKLWRLGWLARVGLIPLVGLQLLWGADAPFYSAHDHLRAAIDLARTGFEGRAKSRFEGFRSSFVAIGEALPPDAKVLFHASHNSLGIDRDIFLDMAGFQALISYHQARTPRELYEYFRSRGITHLLEGQGIWESTRQESVLYNLLMNRYATQLGRFGGYRLAAMPDEPPPAEAPYRVLCLQLHGYADGLYPIERLNRVERMPAELLEYPPPERALDGNLLELLQAADAVLVRGHNQEIGTELGAAFERIPCLGDVTLHVRRR